MAEGDTLPAKIPAALRRRIRVDPSGCWRWTGPKRADGVGYVTAGGGTVRVHRAIYEALRGPVPSGVALLRTCGSRVCVNPGHIRLCSHRETGKAASRRRKCPVCGKQFKPKARETTCGRECLRVSLDRARHSQHSDRGMTGPQVEAYLSHAVAMESAPAYLRHPIPQTGVRVAGGRR